MAVRRGQRRVGWSAALAPTHTHTHTRTLTHTYTQTQKLIKAMCMFVSAGRGGQWPHKTGRKENKGRKGCTVCADQECLLKTKPIKASGIKTRSVWRGTLIAAAWSLVSTRSPLVSGNYRA